MVRIRRVLSEEGDSKLSFVLRKAFPVECIRHTFARRSFLISLPITILVFLESKKLMRILHQWSGGTSKLKYTRCELAVVIYEGGVSDA